MNRSGTGDDLPGTTVFTGARSREGYRLNKLAMTLTDPANRARFLADAEAYMSEMGLAEAQKDMIRRRDWLAMAESGGNIYLLLKIAFSSRSPRRSGSISCRWGRRCAARPCRNSWRRGRGS